MKLFSDNFDMNLLPRDGELNYIENFFKVKESRLYFDQLMAQTPWQADVVRLFGKEIITQRKMALYGDANTSYTYSKKTKNPLPWTSILLEIKAKVELQCQTEFNSCLLNLYHHGEEGMSWHSDNEKELGPNPAIASVSLGAERKFAWKHKIDKDRYDIVLASGSLIYMHGEMQDHWVHSVPKTKKVSKPRINLSFRQIQTRC